MQLCDSDVSVNFKIYIGLFPCNSFNNTFLADERVSLRAVVLLVLKPTFYLFSLHKMGGVH